MCRRAVGKTVKCNTSISKGVLLILKPGLVEASWFVPYAQYRYADDVIMYQKLGWTEFPWLSPSTMC